MSSHKELGQIFVFKALAQCYQSPDISTTAMPDIYLIYSLPKLQSKSCLLKSAVCCAALTNHMGGRASAEGERGEKTAEQETEGRLSNEKRKRETYRCTDRQAGRKSKTPRQIESTQGREGGEKQMLSSMERWKQKKKTDAQRKRRKRRKISMMKCKLIIEMQNE